MSGRFSLLDRPMDGLALVERRPRGDDRGMLCRLFDAEDMLDLGWSGGVAQVNQTVTRKAGTVRGMHFQHAPFADAKLVTCLAGSVLDVAVDLRSGSPTFLRHYATELTGRNLRSLMIGPGFAHGFQALSDDCVLIYAHSAPYRADSEGGLDPLDPALAIGWRLPPDNLSERDRSHPAVSAGFRGIEP